VRRAQALVDAGTTDMAEALLTVPLTYYRDPAVHAQEQQLLRRTPLAIVPSAQIPDPHDFVVRDVLCTSVLVTRAADGIAPALHNNCRHRGGTPAAGCGNARRHTCPYHAWSYDSAGRLVGLPGAAGFDQLDRDAYGLVTLPTEERHGFVWAVLTTDAALDVAAHLGPLDDELASWGATFSGSQFFDVREIEAEVNWKGAIEAFAENYHFPYVHKDSIVGAGTVPNTAIYDGFGPHHRIGFPGPWIEDARHDIDGRDPLASMVFIYWIFPNLTLGVSPVGTEVIDILPAGSAGRCLLRHGWMATVPATDDATRAGYADLYEAVHAAVRDEDFGVLPGCGEASRQGQHDHMVIGRNEVAVQHVVTTFTDALGLAAR
jgi:phenylpropionate dioxygenase-like ring-hydroxylating dioxygenase large terminal subunit